MEQLTAVKPNEADQRMVLISDAGKMTIQAQNALLKALEEPPEHTFFILTVQGLQGIIPTIVSRCRQIRFKSQGCRKVAQYIADTFQVDSRKAAIAAQTTGADVQKALALLNLGSEEQSGKRLNWEERRIWLLNRLVKMILSGTFDGTALFLSERLSREPDNIQDWMHIIRSFFRDLSVIPFAPEKIVNLDFSDAFEDISQMIGIEQGMKFMDIFNETEQRLDSNSSIRLTLDRFFVKISSILGTHHDQDNRCKI